MTLKEYKNEMVESAYRIAEEIGNIEMLWEYAEDEIMENAESYAVGDEIVDKELRDWMLKEYPFGKYDIGDFADMVQFWAETMDEQLESEVE